MNFSEKELAFLRALLKPHVDYYGMVASLDGASPASKAKWAEVSALEVKLAAGLRHGGELP